MKGSIPEMHCVAYWDELVTHIPKTFFIWIAGNTLVALLLRVSLLSLLAV